MLLTRLCLAAWEISLCVFCVYCVVGLAVVGLCSGRYDVNVVGCV